MGSPPTHPKYNISRDVIEWSCKNIPISDKIISLNMHFTSRIDALFNRKCTSPIQKKCIEDRDLQFQLN